MKYLFSVFWIVVIVCYGVSAGADQRADACVTCHSSLGGRLADPVTAWSGSIHQQNDITCDLCHGGNAEVDVGDMARLSGQALAEKQALAMSKDSGFIAKPSGQALFDMCAECHTASVSRYADSIMGKAYVAGKSGPSCVVCHQAHNNIIPAVPEVCDSCHKDTSGFSQIDPMSVTAATVDKLSRIRIQLIGEKTKGSRPVLVPAFPEDLDPYQIGFLAFGAVFVLFLLGCLVYVILEKRE